MLATHRLEVVPSRAAAEYARLPPPVRRLLKLCDGVRTVDALSEHSAIPVAQIEPVLRRLLALGVVSVREPSPEAPRRLSSATRTWIETGELPPPPAPPPAFTDEEEQFFSSSIDHLVDDL